ncbi:hypothetical protein PAMP_013687 [Pampus punctatissimus]
MGKKLTRNEGITGDAMVNMGPDKPVLILKHCHDMKKQEMCLRAVTLLLLLSCLTLFIFTISSDSINFGSKGQESAESGAFSRQEAVFPSGLTHTENMSDEQLIQWKVHFGDSYNAEKCAIVIPDMGKYFVYVKIVLRCQNEDRFENPKKTLVVKLQKWNPRYNKTLDLTDAFDDIVCTTGLFRTVFLGELFDLTADDHVSVFIAKGYKLINQSSFGAYRT